MQHLQKLLKTLKVQHLKYCIKYKYLHLQNIPSEKILISIFNCMGTASFSFLTTK